MTIDVIARIAPLGSFPICSAQDLLGGFREVADNTARDAIPAADRTEGMWVWNVATTTLYRLGAGLTNADWVVITLGGGGGATAFRQAFTNGDLTVGVLTATHSLGQQYNTVSVYDNNDQIVQPGEILAVDANNVSVDLTAIQTANGGSIPGTWNIVVVG